MSRRPRRPPGASRSGWDVARERCPGEAPRLRLTVPCRRWGSGQAGTPIPNGRSQANAAWLDTLPIVAAYRSLGDTPSRPACAAVTGSRAGWPAATQALEPSRSASVCKRRRRGPQLAGGGSAFDLGERNARPSRVLMPRVASAAEGQWGPGLPLTGPRRRVLPACASGPSGPLANPRRHSTYRLDARLRGHDAGSPVDRRDAGPTRSPSADSPG